MYVPLMRMFPLANPLITLQDRLNWGNVSKVFKEHSGAYFLKRKMLDGSEYKKTTLPDAYTFELTQMYREHAQSSLTLLEDQARSLRVNSRAARTAAGEAAPQIAEPKVFKNHPGAYFLKRKMRDESDTGAEPQRHQLRRPKRQRK